MGLVATRDELMGKLQAAQNEQNRAEGNHDARALLKAGEVIKDARAALMEACANLEERVEAAVKSYIEEWVNDHKRILKDAEPLRTAVAETRAKLSESERLLAAEMERVRPELEKSDAGRAEFDQWSGDTIRSTRETVGRLSYYGGQ